MAVLKRKEALRLKNVDNRITSISNRIISSRKKIAGLYGYINIKTSFILYKFNKSANSFVLGMLYNSIVLPLSLK